MRPPGPARPVSYDLLLEPDLRASTFRGEVVARARLSRPASEVRLDAAELDVLSCEARSGGSPVPCAASADPRRESLAVRLGRRVSGEVSVRVRYRGRLNSRMLGFYRSTYRRGRRAAALATTQFEAADARRAFPCWDEPAAKAVFRISVSAPPGAAALSNMPAESRRRLPGGRTLYRFAPTPPMSTYLAYVGVGDFEYLRARSGRTALRAVAVRGKARHGGYALDVARRLLPEYERYFGIRYPLPKLDLVAVPDFAAGAMENWGAMTFREALMLHDPAASSGRTRQLIAEVVSHEIAHQWFGNLVTMEWWNDLWLNESFATLMAAKFVDRIEPGWGAMDRLVGDSAEAAMSLDSLRSSHPVDVPVRGPGEAREVFDAISYDKGACVLRMVEAYVGEARFRAGLRSYLRRHAYGTARGADLWAALGRASGLPVARFVRPWLGQAGFPAVSARRRGRRVLLGQRRFLLGGGRAAGRWPVPVQDGARPRVMSGASGSAAAPRRGPAVVNPGMRGFYRVEHDAAGLLDLKYAVQTRALPPLDRWAAHSDAHAMCLAGRLRLRDYLDFADAYAGDPAYLPASHAVSRLAAMYARTAGGPAGGLAARHALRAAGAALARLGWDARPGEAHTDALLRAEAASAAGLLGDPAALAEARRRFAAFRRRPRSLPPDMRGPVLSLYARGEDSEAARRALASLHARAASHEEAQRALSAMLSFRDPRLLRRSLEYALSPAVRPQDFHAAAARAAASPEGRRLLWPWARRRWGRISAKVGAGNPLLSRVVSSLASAPPAEAASVRAFFAARPAPGTERALRQALERMAAEAAFSRRVAREFRR